MDNSPDPEFEALLDHLKKSRGFDFTGYKRSSLIRRVQKRMVAVDATDFTNYMDYLDVHPQEFDELFNTILINVTSFFRDESAWTYLQSEIIPQIVESTKHVRVWSAGCATGEEAYGIAMLFCEAMGESHLLDRLKVYATDVDIDALAHARAGSYDARALDALPPNLREKYFTKTNGSETFRTDLRRLLIFGRHDLVHDPPIPRIDLLVCRNTLMYLNADTQSRILARFHFALKPTGFLFLGKAEMMLSHSDLFEPLELQHRIFEKVPHADLRQRLKVMAQANDNAEPVYSDFSVLKETSFDKAQIAQMVVDKAGIFALANEKARLLFGLSNNDVGKQFKDLEVSYRPLELRSLIETTARERVATRVGKVSRAAADGSIQFFEVQISPVFSNDGGFLGTSITFENATRFYGLYSELRVAHEELETTNEELESTNEELETTNEELQSTNEELETTNDELQCTNEELETTNAELNSISGRLEATNLDLCTLTDEMESVNAFLQDVLTSLRYGVCVVDDDFGIRIWNKGAEELWGLRSDEVLGKRFFDLDIGLPISELAERIKSVAISKKLFETSVPSLNRRGRNIQCTVRATPLQSQQREGGLVILMEERS